MGSLRPNERSPNVSDSFFGWIKEFYAIPDTWILNHHTLDGYLFLRFLKVSYQPVCLSYDSLTAG